MQVDDFYKSLEPYYHLIFQDWEGAVRRQARALHSIIQRVHPGAKTVLDLACGIGTQSLGLAELGYEVTASDICRHAIRRAKDEADKRNLKIDFTVADMRLAYAHHRRTSDVVIAVDNAIPHLLTDKEILDAFTQFYQCTIPGGVALVTVRDYRNESRSGIQIKPHGVREEAGTRYLAFQVWDFSGLVYDMSLYVVRDAGSAECVTKVMRTRYYAVDTDRLKELMSQAGFSRVRRLDGVFFQPVLVGQRNP